MTPRSESEKWARTLTSGTRVWGLFKTKYNNLYYMIYFSTIKKIIKKIKRKKLLITFLSSMTSFKINHIPS